MNRFKFDLQRFAQPLSGSRVMSGTYGELWLDGELVAEIKRFEARVELNKEDIPLVGKFMTSSKVMSAKGTGSMTLHKVNSRMLKKYAGAIKNGYVPESEALSSLNDPAAYGAERVMVKGIIPDDLTLANWEAGAVGEIECPYTFDDYELIDLVD